jgi:hypothetical protein
MFEVYCDKAGKKLWLRKVIAALGRLHAVDLPLRVTCDDRERAERESEVGNLRVADTKSRLGVGNASLGG